MLLLEAQQLTYHVRDRLLLDISQLDIHHHDRIGLVGSNGTGKTTLLEILAGKRRQETGTVHPYTDSVLIPQLKQFDTTKSGGEVTQQYVQEALTKDPGILLADEPTTNLDVNHIEWLERTLIDWHGACVIVSHDRAFLDALCTKIWELSAGHITEYTGNYSDYAAQKEVERNQQQLAYEQYEKKKRQLEVAQRQKEQKAARATKKPKNLSDSEARIKGSKPYFAKKQKKLQKTASAIETRLEKLEKVEKVKEVAPIKMDLPNVEAWKNRTVLRVEDVDGHIGGRPLWGKTTFRVQAGDKLAIIGPNGCGKTTLIRKIVGKVKGVAFHPAIKIGYFSQDLRVLAVEASIMENVQESSKQNETFIRTVLARLQFYRDDVHKKVSVLSGGERVKVALAKIFLSDANMLILDEPTNFLDIDAMEALEDLLKQYEGTVIFVSHDRQFIRGIATRMLVMEEQEITLHEGDYDHYKASGKHRTERDNLAEQLLLLETKITEIVSRLSINPSEKLENEFQKLLAEKRELEDME